MSDPINRRFILPSRRLVGDAPQQRWNGMEISTVSAATHQQLEKAEQGLNSIWRHLGRMLQTAGHSWAVGEHDVLLTPLHRVQRFVKRYAPKHMQRWQMAYFAMLVIALAAIPLGVVIRNDLRTQRYVLSADVQKLVGNPVPVLDKQITFSQKTHAYQYNPNAVNGIKPPTNSAGDNGLAIGGSKYYGVDLAAAANKGQTFTDAQTKLSFSLTPQFGALDGKHIDGHVVYPIDNGQVVYTLKSNGLKEDVVLSTPTDSVNLRYKLQLPTDLEAKLLPDGSVGIYSADPSLFGNITYGSDKDQASVQKARTNGAKNNLVFQIPAPVVTESGKAKGTGMAKFSLNGDELSVNATKLQNLSYPISIDPSVVVQSANMFTTGNDEDGSNAVIVPSSVNRAPLSGGALGSWTSANTGTTFTARLNVTSVALNGYIYAVGGQNAGGTNNNDVYYSLLSASSVLNWVQATSLLGYNITGDVNVSGQVTGGSLVTYNGYLYLLGTTNSGNKAFDVVEYAKQNSDGSLSSWLFGNGTNTPASSAGGDGSRLVENTTQAYAFAYNNVIYIMGGCTATPIGPCSGETTSIQHAAIHADGSLGTWQDPGTSPWVLPSNRWSLAGGGQAAVYNGRVYIVGGCTAINTFLNQCTGNAGDTIYASINSDGTLGSWATATSTIPTPNANRLGITFYASRGYLYALNGTTGGTNANYALYAPIYANGDTGPWQTTSIYGTPTSGAGYAMYNGYAYQVAGCINSSTNCSTATNVVAAAPINAVGPVGLYGAPGSGATDASMVYAPAVVAAGGYVYAIGGLNGSGTTLGTTRYAQLNSDGTMGAWATASGGTLAQTTYGAAAVAYNGYIYLSGGATGTASVNPCSDVQYATVSAGTLGTWNDAFTNGSSACTNTGMLAGQPGGAAGRYFHQMLTYNGYLYIMGGINASNSSVLADVQFATISNAGTISALHYTSGSADNNTTYVSGMGTARNSFGAVIANGYIYVAGGKTSAANTSSTASAEAAQIQSNGTVGTWNSAGSMPTSNLARFGFGMVVSNGFVYIVGGYHTANDTACNSTASVTCSDTSYAPICNGINTGNGCSGGTAGTIGTWTTTNSITTPRTNVRAVAYNGYIYTLGGCNGTSATIAQFACNSGTVMTDIQYAPLNNGGGGSSGTWNTTTNMPYSTGAGESIAYNGYLYVMGGCTGILCAGGGTFASVYHTTINADGTIGGSWTTDTPMTNSRAAFGLVAYAGKLYVLGGYGAPAGGGAGNQSDAYYATIGASGNITAWTPTSSFSVARQYLSAFANNGYMYIAGGSQAGTTGCNTVANSVCSDVQFAPITSTGALGAWHFTHNSIDDGATFVSGFATGRQLAVGLVNNGYAYIIGGQDGTNQISDVQYAKFNNDGTLGSWAATTSLTYPRSTFIGAAYNGYLYVYNGVTTTSNLMANVEYAPFSSNGTLGRWTVAGTPITTNAATYTYGSGAIANGYIYYMGGQSGISLGNTVSYSPLQVIPRVAHYSRLFDLKSTVGASVGGDPQITRYGFAGTSTPTPISPSGLNFCASNATNSSAVFGTAFCTLAGVTLGTPSAAKGFGRYGFVFVTLDDSRSATFPDSAQSTINEMDVYFHASPARRLRGGQTFIDTNGATNNQLDTEGP